MTPTMIAYRVGWLVDGSGRAAADNRIITVNAGRIQHVLSAGDPLPPDMTVVDYSDCTVFPALIDSHVHLVMSGTIEAAVRQNQLATSYADRLETIASHLRQHLTCGVLAVRDGGDHNGDILRYKLDPANRPLPPVTIAAPGRARRAAGRYGKLIGIPVDAGLSLVDSAFGQPSKRDHLKVVNSGLNSLTQFGVESPPQFDEAELKRAVAAARERGLPTMVHANGHLPVKMAVAAGCDSIEHGFFMGRENLQRMADRGVAWVPTAVTMKAYSDYLEMQGHRSDPSFADVSRENLEHQLEQIGIARQIGVTLALGTDAGSPGVHHGLSVKTELELFIAAGYSVEEAVRCATGNGARLLKLADRGEIAPGKRADFLAVRAPVERLPAHLHRLAHQVVGGQSVNRRSDESGPQG